MYTADEHDRVHGPFTAVETARVHSRVHGPVLCIRQRPFTCHDHGQLHGRVRVCIYTSGEHGRERHCTSGVHGSVHDRVHGRVQPVYTVVYRAL